MPVNIHACVKAVQGNNYMPKFSVKKPFTVLVAVILVVVLGFVSLAGMQTDLLPNMNLPYLLVVTTYPLSLIHI